jgi:hypothetical protein
MNIDELENNYKYLEYPGYDEERGLFYRNIFITLVKSLNEKKRLLEVLTDFLSDQVAIEKRLDQSDEDLAHGWIDRNWEWESSYVQAAVDALNLLALQG